MCLLGFVPIGLANRGSQMEFSIRSSLAGLAIALSCARNCEQFISLCKARKAKSLQAVDQRVSLLTPAAGAAALAYAHIIHADPVLLVATWLNTTTAVVTLAMSRNVVSDDQIVGTHEAEVIHHE